jgi:hypothetical protein
MVFVYDHRSSILDYDNLYVSRGAELVAESGKKEQLIDTAGRKGGGVELK